MVTWFSCYTAVMTSDKFVYLFGRVIPALSLVLSMALRFVPTLAQEALSIRDAQAIRGGSIESGSLPQRVNAMCATIIPVFAGAIRHANNLSLALQARSFEEGRPRSTWHAMHIRGRDIVFMTLTVTTLAAIIAMNVFTI